MDQKQLRHLQTEVVSMRVELPSFYTELLKKETKMFIKNLDNLTYEPPVHLNTTISEPVIITIPPETGDTNWKNTIMENITEKIYKADNLTACKMIMASKKR